MATVRLQLGGPQLLLLSSQAEKVMVTTVCLPCSLLHCLCCAVIKVNDQVEIFVLNNEKHSSQEHVSVLNEIWGSVLLSHHGSPPEVRCWAAVARSHSLPLERTCSRSSHCISCFLYVTTPCLCDRYLGRGTSATSHSRKWMPSVQLDNPSADRSANK